MIRTSFNAGWTVQPKRGPFDGLLGAGVEPVEVTLPHDALRDQPRSAASPQGSHTAYYPSAHVEYQKSFLVPEAWATKAVLLEFEGVYRDAVVYVNDEYAGQRPNGYSGFQIDLAPHLRFGVTNTMRVEARTHQDSRWYAGVGIYRPAWLIVADLIHVELDGVRVTTPDVSDERAAVLTEISLTNATRHSRTVRVHTDLVDPDGAVVASSSAPFTGLPGETASHLVRLTVPRPRLWRLSDAALYRTDVRITDADHELDRASTSFGIRSLQLDAELGLRINGEPVLLRGACIHHDNGALGAAGIPRADERRIELLKAAGFNAIRSSHNPVSRATLDACDRLGVLVMDELTDMWLHGKTSYDASLTFADWWERDIEALVTKDFNHPSVILYSIGNEILEVGTPAGAAWGRRLATKLRRLDPTRFVTNGINGFISVMDRLPELLPDETLGTMTDVNTMIAEMGNLMGAVAASDLASERLEESASVLDVVGFNYADSRYESDALEQPHRVIVGSETFPAQIAELWRLVRAHPHVIGDFTWTGWDYLGESGIGRIDYTDEPGYTPTGVSGAFPYLLASTGDLDITGHRTPVSFYREIVYGIRHEPYIAVHRPQFHGRPTASTPWAWSDSESSWTWDVPPGAPITVDVYADAEEVELILDGRSIATRPVGEETAFVARFEMTYRPGELMAIARSGGAETRTALRTADAQVGLAVEVDRPTIVADDRDLAFVAISIRDALGTVATDDDRAIHVAVEGAGMLAGLGTGRPSTIERFNDSSRTFFDGRAQAIVRPSRAGEILVKVSADGLDPVEVTISAVEA